MSNNEAKFLLDAYRPGGQDAGDAALAEALGQARADPALGRWFATEQAHAAAVAGKLREIAPPADLRDAVLAGCRATQRATPRSARFGALRWLGLAAGIVVLAGLTALFWPRPAANAAELTTFAFYDVQHGRHGGHGVPAEVLQAQLSEPATHLAAGLPVDFTHLRTSGCRTLRVAGRDVLEVCFTRNGAEFHCYIGRASDFGTAGGTTPVFAEKAGMSAAAWTQGAYRYVVVGAAGLKAVKRLL